MKIVTKDQKKPRTWTDYMDEQPTLKKMDMRFGTWNVRSMYRAGSLRAVANEYRRSDGTEVAPNPQTNIHFSMERGMRIMN
jgi:hypothetical protein